MSTFNQLADSVVLHLSGFTTLQEQASHLTATINASQTTATVYDASALSRGLIEIDDELLWVDNADSASNTLTIAPYGRGYRSTTAASHLINTRVSVPFIPRILVKRAINEAILGSAPDLFAVASSTFTYVPGTYTYEIPAGVDAIVRVQWQDATTASEWIDLERWTVDTFANTSIFPSGKSITVKELIVPGRTVRVVYRTDPSVLVNATDDFATVTGLPSSCEDVIRLGAGYRLVTWLDVPHLSGSSAEADFSTNMRPATGAAQSARNMLQQYQLRLNAESQRLNDMYPVRVNYTF